MKKKWFSQWLIDITEAYPTPKQRMTQEWTQAIIASVAVIVIGTLMYCFVWSK